MQHMNIKNYLMLGILFTGALNSNSQNRHENIHFEHDKENVQISVLLNVENYYVQRGDSLTLTPYIISKSNKVFLPKVIITEENKSHISNQNKIMYKAKVPYEAWMENSTLGMDVNLGRIGGEQLYTYTETLKNNINLIYKPRIETPVYTENIPKTESTFDGLLYKTFELPFYKKNDAMVQNPREIDNIRNFIIQIINDEKLALMGIYITAYSSPDGIYYDNQQLTKRQAETFKDALQRGLNYPEPFFFVESVAEDWDGTSKLINEDYLPFRYEVLKIINNVGIFKGREKQLMDLQGGDPYRYMKKYIFPQR